MSTLRRLVLVGIVVFLPLLMYACGGSNESREEVGTVREMATLSSSQVRIAGFELLADWTKLSGTGTLSLTTDRVEGAQALAVSSTQSVTIQSVTFGNVSGGFRKVDVQIKAPSTSKAFLGTVEVRLSSALKAMTTPIGLAALAKTGGFNNYSFAVPSGVVDQLGTSHSDLRFTVKVDLQTAGAIVIDKLVLSGNSTDVVAPPWGSASPVPAGSSLAYASENAAPPMAQTISVDRVGNMVDSVPIEIAPGRAGMQPSLALSYNSSRANGPLGVGWALQGISSITRCPWTLARDGEDRSIRVKRPPILCAPGQSCPERFTEYNDTVDNFCLDGQKLVKTGGTNASPEFRTEIDSFTKITTSYSGQNWPATFKVYTKDGNIHTYDAGAVGVGYDGFDAAGVPLAGKSFQGVLAWNLTRTEDRFGNAVSYTYTSGGPVIGGNAQASTYELIKQIDYTTCAPNTACPYGGATNRVRFEYEDRVDVVGGFTGGLPTALGKRLKKIRTEYISSGTTFKTLSVYLLTYDQSGATNRSRLTEVQQCPLPAGEQEGTACRPPLKFTWGGGQGQYFRRRYQVYGPNAAPTSTPSWQCQGTVGPLNPQPGCIWVDYKSIGTWANSITSPYIDPVVGDFDGNGTDDVVYAMSGGLTPTLVLTNRAAVTNDLTFTSHAQTDAPGSWQADYHSAIDIDSDGRTEIFKRIGIDGIANFRLERFNDTTKLFEPVKVNNQDFLMAGGFFSSPSFMDITGDGFVDLFYDDIKENSAAWPPYKYGQYFHRIAQPTTVGSLPAFAAAAPAGYSLGTPYGRPEGEIEYELYFCKVRAINIAGSARKQFYRYCDTNMSQITRYIDVNGDGTDDSVVIKAWGGQSPPSNPADGLATAWIRESTGVELTLATGDKPEGQMPAPYLAIAAGQMTADHVENVQHQNVVPVDFDGDGQQDLIQSKYASGFGTTTAGQTVWLSRNRNDLGAAGCGSSTRCKVTRFEAVGMPINGTRPHGGLTLGDFNGDGLPDIMQGVKVGNDYRPQLIVQDVRNRDDVITSVNDGKVGQYVQYFSGPTGMIDADSSSAMPVCRGQYCPRKTQNVVLQSSFTQGGGTEQRRYFYEAPALDINGRGFLGYGIVTEWNTTRAQSNVSTYDNVTMDGTLLGKHSYPFAHLPSATQWKSGSSVAAYPNLTGGPTTALPDTQLERVKSTLITNKLRRTNGGLTSFIETTNIGVIDTHASSNYRTVATARTFDDYGNVTAETVTVVGGEKREVTQTCSNTTSTWLLGKCTSTTVKSTRNNETLTRTTSRTFSSTDGSLQTETIAPGDATLEVASTLTRDAAGLVRSTVARDKHGGVRTSLQDYDSRGIFVQHTQNGLGHDNWFAWHYGIGEVLASYDAGGRRSEYAYDLYKRPVSIKEAGEAPVWRDYRASSNYSGGIKVTEKLGASYATGYGMTYQEYDFLGLLRKSSRSLDNASTPEVSDVYVYDTLGRLSSHTSMWAPGQSSAATTYEYDNVNNLRRRIDADGAREETSFISPLETQVVRTTSGGSTTVLKVYSTDGLLTASTQSASEGTRGLTNVYGPFGLLRQVSEDTGPSKTYQYDSYGRKISSIDAESGTTQIQYTGFGEVKQLKRLATTPAIVTDNVYDHGGRLIRSTTDNQISSYYYDLQGADGVGQLGYSVSPDGVYQYRTFDSFGRMAQETTGDGIDEITVGQTFDAMGRLQRLDYPNVPGMTRLQLTYEYDPVHGTLDRVVDASGWEWYTSYERDVTGASRSTRLVNAVYETREIDPISKRTTRISAAPFRSPLVYDVNYRYYSGGNPSLREERVDLKTDEYYYNGFDELKTWIARDNGIPTSKTFTYDKLGNPTGTTDASVMRTFGTGNAAHQLKSQVNFGWTFTYDPLGRQTDKYAHGTRVRHIDYTPFDLPKTIVSTPLGQTARTYNFKYDAHRKRFKKADASSSTVYVAGIYEKRVTSAGTKHIFSVFADGKHVAQRTLDQSTNTYKDMPLLTDLQGSVAVGVLDGIAKPVWYSPWGDKFKAGRTTIDNVTAGFTGHEQEDDLYLINMQGRIYDPDGASFLTPDPVILNPELQSSHNPYVYALNNPARMIDPTGYAPTLAEGTLTYSTPGTNISTNGDTSSWSSYAGNYCSGCAGPSYSAAPGLDTAGGFRPSFNEGGGLAGAQPGTPEGTTVQERTPTVPRDAAGQPGQGAPPSEGGRPNWNDILNKVRWHKTEALAAYIFLDAANPPSIKHNREVYTLIVRRNGKYAYLPAKVGSANASEGFFEYYQEFLDAAPPNTQVTGWAHTHGIYDGPGSNDFSSADIDITKSVGNGYLGTPSGRFKLLQPGEGFGTDLGSLPPCRCYVNP